MDQLNPAFIQESLWGLGQAPTRLQSLMARFDKPDSPLYEPGFEEWSRPIFQNLNLNGMEATTEEELWKCVERLLSLSSSYAGLGPWPQWYGYLAPRILYSPLGLNWDWLSLLGTQLLILAISHAEYSTPLYEAEFAAVLASWIMHPQFWSQGKYKRLQDDKHWKDQYGIYGVEGSLGVSFLLTWRYLSPPAVLTWLQSVLAVNDVSWRAHFIIWLMSVRPIFEQQASNHPVLKACKIADYWDQFYYVPTDRDYKPEYQQWNLIPLENIRALETAIGAEFKDRRYFEWLEQFAARDELWPQMELWLEQFQSKFL